MMSKFLKPCLRLPLLVKTKVLPQVVQVRRSEIIPPTQYDVPFPEKMKLRNVLRNNWEVIPLFTVTAFALFLMFASIASACRNKVDVVWTTHSRNNISRTMDLNNPTCHKLITITQRYDPWPEMQEVLDEMKVAERRALARAQVCYPTIQPATPICPS